jgi:uncharacterized protein
MDGRHAQCGLTLRSIGRAGTWLLVRGRRRGAPVTSHVRPARDLGSAYIAMRRRVLFVQGGGEGAHQVDARLVANLAKELGPDYELHYPLMPHEDTPDYSAWNRVLIESITLLGDGVIVVGHSVGATIVLRSLAEKGPKQPLAGVFLIAAPFIGEGGWQIEDSAAPKNIGAKVPDDVPIYLYHGRDDETVPFAHVDLYAAVIPQAVIRRLAGRDHQLNDNLSEVARDILALNPSRAP